MDNQMRQLKEAWKCFLESKQESDVDKLYKKVRRAMKKHMKYSPSNYGIEIPGGHKSIEKYLINTEDSYDDQHEWLERLLSAVQNYEAPAKTEDELRSEAEAFAQAIVDKRGKLCCPRRVILNRGTKLVNILIVLPMKV